MTAKEVEAYDLSDGSRWIRDEAGDYQIQPAGTFETERLILKAKFKRVVERGAELREDEIAAFIAEIAERAHELGIASQVDVDLHGEMTAHEARGALSAAAQRHADAVRRRLRQ